MSYLFTKEDMERVRLGKAYRTRCRPNDWQKLFHSDWQLEFQGDAAWRSEQPVESNTAMVLGSICNQKGHIMECGSFELPDPPIDWLFLCTSDRQSLRVPFRRKVERDKWLYVLDRFRTHTATEPTINRELSATIQASREILALEDNWDDEGSPAYSEATWRRAVTFLSNSAIRFWKEYQRDLIAPRILPGPDGNIDLHWKTPKRELLISIPADQAEPAAFYGDDKEDGTDNAIRGKGLNTSDHNEWVFAWLMR